MNNGLNHIFAINNIGYLIVAGSQTTICGNIIIRIVVMIMAIINTLVPV
jgi:hypothetical protein